MLRQVVGFAAAAICISCVTSVRVSLAAESESVTALKAALAKNVEHAGKWLDEKDHKSLAQSTGGIALLAELLKSKSDDPAWQAVIDSVLANVNSLQAAARAEVDWSKCQQALAALQSSVAATEKIEPAGKATEIAKAPAIRPLMLTMDGIQADAKIALMTGNVAAAKKQAIVLAELSRLVSNSRNAENWSALAGDFAKACTVAAESSETDAKTVRQLFRGIAERCEACHEQGRTR